MRLPSAANVALCCLPLLFGTACGARASLASPDELEPSHRVHPDALRVADLGSEYVLDPARTPAALAFAGPVIMEGSTSIRRLRGEDLNFKSQGYFVRNREIGQVFTAPADLPPGTRVDAIVLRTGNSGAAVRKGAPGAPLYVQWFRVEGTPTIDDRGTGPGTDATHGFTTNHRADDVVTGVRYEPLLTAEGGTFPAITPTTTTGGEAGHLRYLRFDLQSAGELVLEPGARYAFLVGFTAPGADRGFTLANANATSESAAPTLTVGPAGELSWCIRREGDGTLPPTLRPGPVPAIGTPLGDSLRRESLHPDDYLTSVSPTSDGYPDVDTYRTLEFYVEVK